MKSILKKIVKKTICFFLDKTKKTRIGPFLYQQIATNPMEKVLDVFHGDLKLKFVVPNQVCEFRALTFSTKEPETLEWIDSIPDGSILWDIGANVGLYTCYAAKKEIALCMLLNHQFLIWNCWHETYISIISQKASLLFRFH